MNRTSHPTALPGGLFTDGDPGASIAPTVVDAAHMNAVQEELVGTIEAAGLTPDAGNLDQLAQSIRILATGNGGLKNLVVNGDFNVWQRGTSFASIPAAERYTADRWAVSGDGSGGSGVATLTRQSFSTGQTEVPGARFHARYQQTSPSTAGGGKIATKIEAIEELANGQVSVSFYAKASASITATLNLVNVYGAASAVTVATASVALTTSWQRFTVTRTMPSIAGQSVDFAVAHVRVELVLPTGSPLVDLARFQVERSSIASPFEARSEALEVQLCRRYFEKSYELPTAPGTASTLTAAQTSDDSQGGTIATLQARFRVPKRATPTVAWYSPATGTLNRILQFTGNVDLAVIQVHHISRDATGWPEIGQTFADTRLLLAHWTADAEL